uniref:Uncharacterized protein n=1 Tax=Amphimedon queenslandica TaxID=400682 RepID=A0A1X7U994_AMPQE
MFVYAAATLTLIDCIGHPKTGGDVWYADDASACSPLADLLTWFSKLLSFGPSYGYYLESQKCVLVVSPDRLKVANELFASYGVKVTTSQRLLGGVVGDQSGSHEYVKGRVNEWITITEKLVLIAETQPQLSYSAYSRSIQSHWTYLQRVVPECGSFFEPVENIITEQLLPTLFGSEIFSSERSILNPVDIATHNYSTSRKLSAPITNSLKCNTQFDMTEFADYYDKISKEITKDKDVNIQRKFDDIISEIDHMQQRAVNRAKEMSSWLNVNPVAKHHFDLSAQEFRDSLAIRYRKPLLQIPHNCDGCNEPFDLSHVKGEVVRESVVREGHNSTNSPALVADLSVCGVWMPQSEVLFDVRIIDTDARSYRNRSPPDVLSAAEEQKKKEASMFVKRLSERLSIKWGQNYCGVVCWVRTRLTFAILRATILCLRGYRTKWRSINIADGSPINLIMT